MNKTKHENLPSEKSFGLVFAVFFSILGAYPIIGGNPPRVWCFILALALAVASVTFPNLLFFPNLLWYRFGSFMHQLTQPVILGVVFFFIITPFGVFIRILGADLLRLKKRDSVQSYWLNRESTEDREKMRLQF